MAAFFQDIPAMVLNRAPTLTYWASDAGMLGSLCPQNKNNGTNLHKNVIFYAVLSPVWIIGTLGEEPAGTSKAKLPSRPRLRGQEGNDGLCEGFYHELAPHLHRRHAR